MWLLSFCRATIHAIGAYLDAFQKIADAATNARGIFFNIFIIDEYILQHKCLPLSDIYIIIMMC